MSSTLTIRLPKEHRAALKRRAASLRKTESDLVRELIAHETGQRFQFENVRKLAGVIRRTGKPDAATNWRQQIRERNWRK